MTKSTKQLCILLSLVLCTVFACVGCKTETGWETIPTEEIELPWEIEGKTPEEYSWDEFNALSGAQQIKFQNAFKNEAEFEAWMNKVQGNDETAPWEEEEKKPSDYTWEEFLALSGDLQIQFQNSFESDEAFENWMLQAQNAE